MNYLRRCRKPVFSLTLMDLFKNKVETEYILSNYERIESWT